MRPALQALKAYLAENYVGWPLRWQNQRWPDAQPVDADGNPVDGDGALVRFIEAEMIAGKRELAGFGDPVLRQYVTPGIVRFYLFELDGDGMEQALAQSDALGALLQHRVIGRVSDYQYVRLHDYSSYADVAGTENGNYAVLMASVAFQFFHRQ